MKDAPAMTQIFVMAKTNPVSIARPIEPTVVSVEMLVEPALPAKKDNASVPQAYNFAVQTTSVSL